MGVDGFPFAVSKLGALTQRMYRGGAFTVTETGPKDLVFELQGCPLVRSRFFCLSYIAYTKASTAMFCKATYVKHISSRKPHPDTFALCISWV